MNPAGPSSSSATRATRNWARLSTTVFLAGFVSAILLVRQIPPAPVFSPQLRRANYWQSYESAYFASLRAYEQPIHDLLRDGYIPIVVFGDSSIRGTGAVGDAVWTRQLEQRLQAVNARVRVVNYAQNAGDLMGPFLFHHLQAKFPAAYYIVQWHFSSEVGVRHPFHMWLTSEIALRDGDNNPAVHHSFKIVPVTSPEERYTFVLAGLDILTHYLDAGNWIRYRWLGRPLVNSNRQVEIQPLSEAAESDVTMDKFIPPTTAGTADQMSGFFLAHLGARHTYIQRPWQERAAYFEEMYPSRLRSHLLVLSGDFNPYYAPHQDATAMNIWRTIWDQLRADMARIPNLRWVSYSGSNGLMQVEDFIDLGHMTPHGQQRVAEAVAGNLLGKGGWFDPANPGAEKLPEIMAGRWCETRSLRPYQMEPFRLMAPRPSRFYSTYGPALYGEFYFAHPDTRLRFQVTAGHHVLRTSAHFNPAAYEHLPAVEATDGVQLEVALLSTDGHRSVVYDRTIDPLNRPADRVILPVEVAFDVSPGAEIEVFVGPGKSGQSNRDWVYLGPLTIQ